MLGATQYLGYSKLLRLAAPTDTALGQLVTYCTGDSERVMEAIATGGLVFSEARFIVQITCLVSFLILRSENRWMGILYPRVV